MIIFKALGVLLTYPTPELQTAAGEIAAVIDAEKRLPKREKAALHALLEMLSMRDTLALQERYVALFDRGRATSLNLFEHLHGESRDRGPAMVDLLQVYTRAGYSLTSSELPDFLPAMLEFLSGQSFAQAEDMLVDCAHILRKVGDALRSRDSRYDAVFAALLAMIGEAGLSEAAGDQRGENANVADEKSLDEDWMDAPVIFGPEGAPACKPTGPATSVINFIPRQH